MFDLHYDLLSILYYCYKINDFSYIEEIKDCFNESNVEGCIANLYFMSKEEMPYDIGKNDIDVVEMFKISTNLCSKYFPNLKVVYGIEGCDYIVDENELSYLKTLGLQSIMLVWNNKNKYGGGAKSDGGLTKEGINFLKKAIELELWIDLSHMNKETFWDTINLLKEEKNKGKKTKVLVSHSNCSVFYEHIRNIDDEQINALKEFDGLMALVPYAFFLTDKDLELNTLKEIFLEHIVHAIEILGVDNVCIATDDMTYDKYFFNETIKKILFSYKKIKKELELLLKDKLKKEEIDKLMINNVYEKLLNESL